MHVHEYANIFPALDGDGLNQLAADIAQNGLQNPIVIFEGKILDGRNRFAACEIAGIEPEYEDYEGNDALGYVISLNLHRRHLSTSQRAMVFANIATLQKGVNQHTEFSAPSQAKTASLLSISIDTGQMAKRVKEHGIPELTEAVAKGKISISAASDIATAPKQEQKEIVAKGEKEILKAAKEIRARKADVQRDIRIKNIEEISKGNAVLTTDRKFPVIYADPPWQYENPPMGGGNRSIENHYPTMTLEEICAMPVSEIANDDCILYLWATAPKLAECMKVIESWGFSYRTCFVWVKDKIGMGYHARNQHELLLVAKRGELPPPAVKDRVSSVLYGERKEHSKKPVEFYELIESMYPELSKIELFCRKPRDGWKVWGNQSDGA